MIRKLLVCAMLLACQLFASAHSAGADFIAVSDVLFPQARSWTNVASTPLSASALQGVKGALEQAYRDAGHEQQGFESDGCSFISRALEASEAGAFHDIDLDRDGLRDIVYIGSAQCAEGSVTLIWHGTARGYAIREPGVLPLRLLRVSADGRSTSVREGCCDEPNDIYYTGSLRDPRQGGALPVRAGIVLPHTKFDRPRSFIARDEIKLRSSPGLLDAYDRDASEHLDRAVFGNVIRRYLPNSKGLALGTTTASGQKWIFVVMDPESNRLVSHDPYLDGRAGWLPVNKAVVWEEP